MTKDISVFLDHILESVTLIGEYTMRVSDNDFYHDTELQDAVMRRLEIIGEAIKHIPDDFRTAYPSIAWKSIAGLRDKLIHEYFGVDTHLVWGLVKKDLPILEKEIQRIRSSL